MNERRDAAHGLPGAVADQRARDITQETEACDVALRTLLAHLGSWADRVVLVGGLSPRYLIPELPDGIVAHMGTTDVDLVLTLALPTAAAEPELPLGEQLRALGFTPKPERELPDGPSFRWTRRVHGLTVKVEFMCPAHGRKPLTVEPDPVPGTGEELGALRLPGAELVARDYVELDLRGPALDGTDVTVRLRVANLLPFLILKAFALDERSKDKDAYDIVWLLSAYADGPAHAARVALASPVLEEPIVRDAIIRLREHFGARDARGPELYAQAFGVQEPSKRIVLQRYAHGTVQQFLRSWAAGRTPPT